MLAWGFMKMAGPLPLKGAGADTRDALPPAGYVAFLCPLEGRRGMGGKAGLANRTCLLPLHLFPAEAGAFCAGEKGSSP
jgi:hypothetical protein